MVLILIPLMIGCSSTALLGRRTNRRFRRKQVPHKLKLFYSEIYIISTACRLDCAQVSDLSETGDSL